MVPTAKPPHRVRIEVQGAVQGVGFRPFVWRLARDLSLAGWVINDGGGLTAELEGMREALDRFLMRLEAEAPPAAAIASLESEWLDPVGFGDFQIRDSDRGGRPTVQILPELATCEDCLRELRDPANRRYRYPFTNCTLCGPRFTIVRDLPYDRPHTSMASFALCKDCRREYESPLDRRFHAQPNACDACGPRLNLLDADGEPTADGDDALRKAARLLGDGRILAVKGLGGFHLLADARSTAVVERLRERKPRRHKPFALLVRDLDAVRTLCHVDPDEVAALTSTAAPIVLLRRRTDAAVSCAVAPDNPWLGIMLPYSPLHHLLAEETDFPLVATSGNLSEEPICTRSAQAVDRLAGIAEAFLTHDRGIVRHVDDSVTRVLAGEVRLLRRARGYAPRPVTVADHQPTILAVGGHLKNTVALGIDRQVFVSQHIGDMGSAESLLAFEAVVDDFLRLYEARPIAVAHDLHPDYTTTRWLREAGDRFGDAALVPVQHHHAHFAACLAENAHHGEALGVIWDGTGYGTDGTVWGGEFLLGSAASVTRFASLRSFSLPGGEKAIREPRRSALALLWELHEARALEMDDLPSVIAFEATERRLLAGMLERNVNCPVTTSAGRLFDGVASLLDLGQRSSFEGQAAMRLEHAAMVVDDDAYPIEIVEGDGDQAPPWIVDWRVPIEALLEDSRRGIEPAVAANWFHGALVEAIARIADLAGRETIALSGGCFQNRLLVDRTVDRLRRAGFQVLLHRHVPPNDGGISLGQVAVAAAQGKALGGGAASPLDEGDCPE